jgi:glycosyltransferase involved in cell wall biosynthesis
MAIEAPAPAPAVGTPRAGRGPKVLHFVTGGFSGGATQVAIALTEGALAGGTVEPLLVLRRKRHTDPRRIAELVEAGLPVRTVPGWSNLVTIAALARLCRRFRPDVLVAHGYSEHLWGRYAGLLAGVPALVHVEHNTRERYTPWRRAQTRWLSRRTARIIGCSEGVRQALLAMGMPPERTIAIPNGIRTAPFDAAPTRPFGERTPGLVMVARFSKQKDHASLLRALALLRERGLRPPLSLVGGGGARHRRAVERLAADLGLDDGQVRVLGIRRDVPELLMGHQICVLSTHHEGMPLALVEGMAAGCAVIGSAVPGVREMIADGIDGRLVPPRDPAALALAIEALLRDPGAAARIAARGRDRALTEFSRERMTERYEALVAELATRAAAAPRA